MDFNSLSRKKKVWFLIKDIKTLFGEIRPSYSKIKGRQIGRHIKELGFSISEFLDLVYGSKKINFEEKIKEIFGVKKRPKHRELQTYFGYKIRNSKKYLDNIYWEKKKNTKESITEKIKNVLQEHFQKKRPIIKEIKKYITNFSYVEKGKIFQVNVSKILDEVYWKETKSYGKFKRLFDSISHKNQKEQIDEIKKEMKKVYGEIEPKNEDFCISYIYKVSKSLGISKTPKEYLAEVYGEKIGNKSKSSQFYYKIKDLAPEKQMKIIQEEIQKYFDETPNIYKASENYIFRTMKKIWIQITPKQFMEKFFKNDL